MKQFRNITTLLNQLSTVLASRNATSLGDSMVRRYNPPPNWPAPPPGWTPPPGWQPDPEWGPAPEGWSLWLEKPGWIRRHKKLTVGLAVGAVVVIAAAANGGTETPDTKVAVAASTTTTAPTTASVTTDEPTPKPTTADPTTAEPADPTTAEPVETTAPPPPPAAPKKYVGRGSKVVRIKPTEEVGLVTLTHRGTSNFAVWAVGSDGGDGDLLVNDIGGYKGTRIYNAEEGSKTAAFRIEADGAWTMTLRPLSSARQWSGANTSGKGDDVLLLGTPTSGLETLTATHKGQANFVVTAYGDTRDLLVNEIGRYSGEVLLPDGTLVLVLEADGSWTLRRS